MDVLRDEAPRRTLFTGSDDVDDDEGCSEG